MEIIYPRDTRKDNQTDGVLGSTPVVSDGVVNDNFQQWLTQYFNEDNSKTIIETINNYGAEMPDVGFNELVLAYMQAFENELKQIKNALKNPALGSTLIQNHTVVDLGVFNWNGNAENIYMLSGGVPATITINQYINNICGVAIFGSEFTSLDAATGVIPISVYPLEYIKTLLDNNVIIQIGEDKYVPLTICEIELNNNELGDLLIPKVEIVDNSSIEYIRKPYGYLYNGWAVDDVRKISSSDIWSPPTAAQFTALKAYVGADPNKLNSIDPTSWDDITGHLDIYGFGNWGSGSRTSSGFVNWGTSGNLRGSGQAQIFINHNVIGDITTYLTNMHGLPVRLVSDAAEVPDGTVTEYIGNNGLVYIAVAVNGLYWTMNLEETNFRNGDAIPNVQDDVEWEALDTAAFCVYNNESYANIGSGAISVVDNSEISVLEIESGVGLKPKQKLSEIDKLAMSSLYLRKI